MGSPRALLACTLLVVACAPAAVRGLGPADVSPADATSLPDVSAELDASAVPDAATVPDAVAVDAPTVPDAQAVPDAAAPDAQAVSDVPGCTTSRMCPGQVCDTARGVCVDCLADLDCTGGQRCVEHRCVAPPTGCRSDRDCSASNQVCNLTRMECVDCVTARDCAAGNACTAEGLCRPLVCMPGAASCADVSTRRVCSADGTRATDTPCASGANAAARCEAGACALRCNTGFADCDGDAATGCEADLSSPLSCGACGRRCADGDLCAGGTCSPAPCAPGQGRCQGRCTDLQSNTSNCGACGRVCVTANGQPACVAGVCTVRACNASYGDCNNTASDGCEVPLTSNNHCGACGRTCAGGQACVAGACMMVAACGAGETRCGVTCANLSTSVANCGACNRACGAYQRCYMGACVAAPPLDFRITWTGTADVDLRVLTPSGQEVTYATPRVGGGVHSGDDRSSGPEQVLFSGSTPPGTYIACAIPFSLSTTTVVSYAVDRDAMTFARGTRTFNAAAPSNSRCTSTSPYIVSTVTY